MAKVYKDLYLKLKSSKVLLIVGTNDQFTSINKYRNWNNSINVDNWSYVEIENGDHFWMDDNTLDQTFKQISQWMT